MKNIHPFQHFAKGKPQQAKQNNPTTVIYTRVSSKEQADTNQSLEIQRKYCTEYAEKNGLKVLGFLVERMKAQRQMSTTSLTG